MLSIRVNSQPTQHKAMPVSGIWFSGSLRRYETNTADERKT